MSKRAFGALDAHLWRLAWKWANFSHPNKPRRWIITRHFGMFNPARQDKWGCSAAASRAVGWPAVPPAVPDQRSLLEALEQARLRSFSEGPQVVSIVTGWPAG